MDAEKFQRELLEVGLRYTNLVQQAVKTLKTAEQLEAAADAIGKNLPIIEAHRNELYRLRTLAIAEEVISSPAAVDFIFEDDKENLWRVRSLQDGPWLCYLHPDKKWVTQRKVLNWEIELFLLRALPAEKSKELEYGCPLKSPAGCLVEA